MECSCFVSIDRGVASIKRKCKLQITHIPRKRNVDIRAQSIWICIIAAPNRGTRSPVFQLTALSSSAHSEKTNMNFECSFFFFVFFAHRTSLLFPMSESDKRIPRNGEFGPQRINAPNTHTQTQAHAFPMCGMGHGHMDTDSTNERTKWKKTVIYYIISGWISEWMAHWKIPKRALWNPKSIWKTKRRRTKCVSRNRRRRRGSEICEMNTHQYRARTCRDDVDSQPHTLALTYTLTRAHRPPTAMKIIKKKNISIRHSVGRHSARRVQHEAACELLLFFVLVSVCVFIALFYLHSVWRLTGGQWPLRI